jgi:hypothetical protein
MFVPPEEITRRLAGAFQISDRPCSGTLVMIVHFPEAHMQWQRARIGQIA